MDTRPSPNSVTETCGIRCSRLFSSSSIRHFFFGDFELRCLWINSGVDKNSIFTPTFSTHLSRAAIIQNRTQGIQPGNPESAPCPGPKFVGPLPRSV